jgi:hypothetical protein
MTQPPLLQTPEQEQQLDLTEMYIRAGKFPEIEGEKHG